MGCWNETCMMSHLPIRSGDHVAATILARRNTTRDTCYADGAYVPIVPLFYGEYDEYGNLENIQGAGLAVDLLKEMKPRLSVGRDKHAFTPDVHEESFIRDTIDAIRQDGLYLKEKDYSGEHQLELHACFMRRELASSAFDLSVDYDPNLLDESPYEDPEYFSRMVGAMKTRIKKTMADHDPKLEAEVRKLHTLQCFLEVNRIPWHATMGSGSQSGIGQLQLAWHKLVAQTAENVCDYEWEDEE